MKKIISLIGIGVAIFTFLGLTIDIKQPNISAWEWNKPDTQAENTLVREAAITELQQRKHLQSFPIPTLERSQERKNLIARLNRFNSDDKVSYIYLINFGKVMAFYAVKGKVSSVNSMLTTTEQLVNGEGAQCSSSNSTNCYNVPSPDIDGSYGSNGNAIFFFTTDDIYVEWSGDYMLADQALKLTQQPELIRQIK